MRKHNRILGFSVVEMAIIMVVITTLASLTYVYLANGKNKAYFTRLKSDSAVIASAASLYAQKYGSFPAEVARDVPAGMKEFIDPNVSTDNWPDGPYPGSVYDWESWDLLNASTNTAGTDGVDDTFQISLRWCTSDAGPLASCKFPNESWASGFNIHSAAYYCIKGYCRAFATEAKNYPGYCINCPNNTAIQTPDGM